jgi:hypothetical protein
VSTNYVRDANPNFGAVHRHTVSAGETEWACRRIPVSDKLRTLLRIAAATQETGRHVTAEVEAARAAGASDIEIHDTVLIAAAFCMLRPA